MKAGMIIFILVLGNMIGPAFCANPVVSNMIEEQMNDNFKIAISNLPDDTAKPLKNTLGYIKNKAKCNDWEAAQINALMSIHSNQKQGYDYYARYLAGNTTVEEDSADYYRAIRLEWDQYLKEYADMTPTQRSNSLMTSATNEDVSRILNSSSPDELEYIQSKVEPYEKKMKDKLNELNSKSTSWMIGHIDSVKEYGNDINKTYQDYNEAIVAADKEWNLKQPNNTENIGFNPLSSSLLSDEPYDESKAYTNVLKAINALSGIKHDYDFDQVIDSSKIHKNDLVQYVINGKDANSPMYKYFMIYDENNQNNTYEVRAMSLTATNMMGDTITEDKDDENHDISSLDYQAWDSNIWVDKNDIAYHGAYTIHTPNDFDNLRDLFTIYGNIDPTGLEKRIDNIFSRPDSNLKSRAVGELCLGSVVLAGGVGAIIAGIVCCCTVVGAVVGLPLILSGIALTITGIGIIVGGYGDFKSYNHSKDMHNTQNSNIFNDIVLFNRACT